MADGMLRIEDPDQHPLLEDRDGVRVLAAESDYNAYCFYVAGTVGHMATELVVVHYGLADDVATRLSASCEACGRGLQKTNILKDFAEDLGRGISYLPYTWHREADFAPLSLAGAPVQWKKKSSTTWFASCIMPPNMSWRCPTTQPAIGWPVS